MLEQVVDFMTRPDSEHCSDDVIVGRVDGDLLPFREREVAARHGGRQTWVHATSVAEPPDRNRG